jgi:ribosomal-protein-alanine N-acetyltransferase
MQRLSAAGLDLEPLVVAHADEMFAVLSDPELYRHLDDGPPPSLPHLREIFARWERRASPDGTECWLNWVVRLPDGPCIGYVQATVVPPGTAWMAFVFARNAWGRGYARASTAAVIEHLQRSHGTSVFLATVAAANHRSIALLQALSFREAPAAGRTAHNVSPGDLLFVRPTSDSRAPGAP